MKRRIGCFLVLGVWAAAVPGWSQDVQPPPLPLATPLSPPPTGAYPEVVAPGAPALPATGPYYPPPASYAPPPPASYAPPPPASYAPPPPASYAPPPPGSYTPPPGAVMTTPGPAYPYAYPPTPAYPGPVLVGPPRVVLEPAPPLPSYRWNATADALFLERSSGGSVFLGSTNWNSASGYYPALQTYNLHSDDSPFVLEPGLRVELSRQFNDTVTISGTFWGLQQWSQTNAVYGDPAYQSVLATSPYLQLSGLLTGQGFDDNLTYAYQSQVDNVELNASFRLSSDPYWQLDWLVGARYLYFADQFTLTGVDDLYSATEQLAYGTTNNLIGAQTGLVFTQGWARFQWDVGLKLALMANVYHQHGVDSASGAGVPAGFSPSDVSNDGCGFSALFEFSLGLRVNFTENLALRLGYQLYDITGLALAPKQLGGFDHGGNVLLDGLSVGLQATW